MMMMSLNLRVYSKEDSQELCQSIDFQNLNSTTTEDEVNVNIHYSIT